MRKKNNRTVLVGVFLLALTLYWWCWTAMTWQTGISASDLWHIRAATRRENVADGEDFYRCAGAGEETDPRALIVQTYVCPQVWCAQVPHAQLTIFEIRWKREKNKEKMTPEIPAKGQEAALFCFASVNLHLITASVWIFETRQRNLCQLLHGNGPVHKNLSADLQRRIKNSSLLIIFIYADAAAIFPV